jgi:outer membrane protein insertion porin family
MLKRFILCITFFVPGFITFAQTNSYTNLPVVDYTDPKEYTIADIKVSGVKFLDTKVLISMSGLAVGQKITVPGDNISKIIDKFWKQGLFSDVKVVASKIEGDKIWIDIYLQEYPRISDFQIKGVKKGDITDLKDKLGVKSGTQYTDNLVSIVVSTIQKHYKEKGYWNAKVKMTQSKDTTSHNKIFLTATISKGKKVKIKSIDFVDNVQFTDRRLRRALKKTHQKSWNFFRSSKFVESDYKEDKSANLEDFFAKNGYRDYKLISDSIVVLSPNRIAIQIKIHEGNQYHLRNIRWIGNTKYPDETLDKVLKMKKGDVYDLVTLDKRIEKDDDAVHSIYYDNGYLFSGIQPVEAKIEHDSIDLDVQITEGQQATIKNIIITGNTKTNEHVVRRELYTTPGNLFSKSDIMNSARRLGQLGHFNPEKIVPEPLPNASDGTVDIRYSLEEKPNDQLEVSGGWGGNMLVGTIGLRFNNFSIRNVFNGSAWRPVPSGDGQSLSIRAQTNGSYYKAYSLSFTEPWFGGKKPNSFSVELYHTIQNSSSTSLLSSSDQSFIVSGVSVGLGRRLPWFDQNFVINNAISFQNYKLNNWTPGYFIFNEGTSKNISLKTTFSRNSMDQMIFPRSGSNFSIGLQVTVPYSLFKKDNFWQLSAAERVSISAEDVFQKEQANRYKWIEYHKWTYKGAWFTQLAKNFVFTFNSQFGYLGYYSKNLGYSPFEGFTLGGDGLAGYNLYGKETIGLRGYENESVTPTSPVTYYSSTGVKSTSYTSVANMYTKLTSEFRYLVLPEPTATIYVLAFLEGGNAWYNVEDFNPFSIKRSAGVGVRAFLPMFGMLGLDWGYGFDAIAGNPAANKGQFHFTMGQQF